MKYDPNNHRRRSIRLEGYDYSQAGFYFVTICTQKRLHLFGEIIDGEMVLNDAGLMVKKWYMELDNKFHDIKPNQMIIMPNHIHFIAQNVGADLRVCPDPDQKGEHSQKGEHVGSPLPVVVQWFKTMTTNEYIRGVKTKNWQRFDGKLWQRNYWEHIVRNEKEYNNIAQYIIDNPAKWQFDKLNGGMGNQVMELPEHYNEEKWMV